MMGYIFIMYIFLLLTLHYYLEIEKLLSYVLVTEIWLATINKPLDYTPRDMSLEGWTPFSLKNQRVVIIIFLEGHSNAEIHRKLVNTSGKEVWNGNTVRK